MSAATGLPNTPRVISVCSGAGGMDLGFHRAGFRTVALCEVDPWRRDLLRARFPGVPVFDDLTALDPSELPHADVLIGGTPCQDLSVAGQRAGLDGERSGLYWDFQRIRLALGIRWTVWENVAGALSSNRGLDFAQVLAAFVGADVAVPTRGWGGAGVVAGPWGGAVWRVLDAQHFGVPQRRRRVFVVGRLGGPCPPEVLLEQARSNGHPDPGASQGTRTSADALGVADDVGGESPYAPPIAAPLTCGSATPGISGPGRRQEDQNIVATLPARGATGGFDVDPAMAAGGHLVAATLGARGRGGGNTADLDRAGAYVVDGEPVPVAGGGGDALGRRDATDGGRGAQRDEAGRLGVDGDAECSDGADVEGRELRAEPARRGAGERDGGRPEDGRREAGTGLPGGEGGPAGEASDSDGVLPPHGVAGLVGESGGDVDGAGRLGRCALDLPPDGPRYAACGDGVVAPVAGWIGRRLLAHMDRDEEQIPGQTSILDAVL